MISQVHYRYSWFPSLLLILIITITNKVIAFTNPNTHNFLPKKATSNTNYILSTIIQRQQRQRYHLLSTKVWSSSSSSSSEKISSPPLGVSVYHLTTGGFKSKFDEYNSKKNYASSVANIFDTDEILKGENDATTTYVDRLEGKYNVGPVTHILSYSSDNRICDMLSALEDYCLNNNLDERETYVYISCLCSNDNNNKKDKLLVQEFERIFKEITVARTNDDDASSKTLLALMTPWDAPIYLTQIRCIYEAYTAIISPKACNFTIIMPPSEKVKFIKTIKKSDGNVYGGAPNKLWKILAGTRIQDAIASSDNDKDYIMNLVSKKSIGRGGLESVDVKVNGKLREWISETIVEMVKKAEGESLVDVSTNNALALLYNNIGCVYLANGEYNTAIEYYEKCLNIREKNKRLDDTDSNTASVYMNIGSCYNRIKQYEKAMDYYFKCLPILESNYGKEHPDTTIAYSKIGQCYDQRGQHEEAEPYHKECLAIRERTLGKTHSLTAVAYNCLGICYENQGEYNTALRQYKKCVSIYEKQFGVEHPETATLYYNIGTLYSYLDNYSDASKYTKLALEIYEKVLGPNHPYTVNSRKNYDFIQLSV